MKKSNVNFDKTYSWLKKLIDDAEYEITGIVEDTETNRSILMDALRLVRLTEAKERSGEAIAYVIDLIYSESHKEYFQKSVNSIELIGDVLANDFKTYEKVLKIINNESVR